MKEIVEFRINYGYADILFDAAEGKNVGTSVKIVMLSKEDPRYGQVQVIDQELNQKFGKKFFFGWQIKRKYSKSELDAAKLLHLKIKTVFEPSGEECGTIYNEAESCSICGAGRKQVSSLALKEGTIPHKDIARTIGGEVVVSERLKNAVSQRKLKGLSFNPTNVKGYYQLTPNNTIELSPNTVAGINPFDLSTSNEGEVYKCPRNHTIGLNLLSESYIFNSPSIMKYDFFASTQRIGVRRGLLNPEPIYFCSQGFRKMIEEEKLSGFELERANIV